MSIFNLHSEVVSDYHDFVRSFFTVVDALAREFIKRELDDLEGGGTINRSI